MADTSTAQLEKLEAEHAKRIAALQEIMDYDKSAKVIMVTAASQKNKMLEAVKFGASDFLSKPFEKDMIISIIDNVLR